MKLYLKVWKKDEEHYVHGKVSVSGEFDYNQLVQWITFFKRRIIRAKYPYLTDCPELPRMRVLGVPLHKENGIYVNGEITVITLNKFLIAEIKNELYRLFNVEEREMERYIESREVQYCRIRQVGMSLCCYLTDASLNAIGKEWGKDHATVLHTKYHAVPSRILQGDYNILNAIDHFAYIYEKPNLLELMSEFKQTKTCKN